MVNVSQENHILQQTFLMTEREHLKIIALSTCQNISLL